MANEPDAGEVGELSGIRLGGGVEAEIAVRWADNIAAAQLTRTVARAMVTQGRTEDEIREAIRNQGREVP